MERLPNLKSDYFTLDEFVKSETATRLRIDNTPPADVVRNLQYGVEMILDPLRRAINRPVIISSGYRCPALNKVVGGVSNSWHLKGNAADIHLNDKAEAVDIFHFLKQNVSVDTVLFEHSKSSQWIHVQWDMNNTPRHRSDWNYIAKVLFPFLIMLLFASCHTKKAALIEQRTTTTNGQKDSTYHLSEEWNVQVIPADTAQAGTATLLNFLNIVGAATTRTESSTPAAGLHTPAIITITHKADGTTTTTRRDTIRTLNEQKNDKTGVTKNRHSVVFLGIFVLFLCLVVIFIKKIMKKFWSL